MTEKQAQALFAKQLALFRRYFKLAGVTLHVHDREFTPDCSNFRDVAWADFNNSTINVCARVLTYSKNTFLGLIRHEIGHLCDPFAGTEGCEQRADDIAAFVTGDKIRYSGPHILQTIGSGMYPRPSTIHAN